MLSYQAIARPHSGQAERGLTTERRRGRRWMQTFRNEPTTAPSATTKSHGRKPGMPPASAPEDQAAAVTDLARPGIVLVVAVLGIARQVLQDAGIDDLLDAARGAAFLLTE